MPVRTTCYPAHHWVQIPSGREPQWGALITFRCEDCGKIREDIFNQFTGELDHRNYVNPDRVPPSHTLDEWRLITSSRRPSWVKKEK